jgi:DNA-binding MarR family transcriptional regulator
LIDLASLPLNEKLKKLESYQFSESIDCEDRILLMLLDDNWGFEDIVKGTKKSRGTVNTHLKSLYAKGYVQYEDSVNRNLSRPYTLTSKGKRETEQNLASNTIRSLSEKALKHLVINYKLMVVDYLHSISNRPPFETEVYADFKTQTLALDKDGKPIKRMHGGPFTIPKENILTEEDIKSIPKNDFNNREQEGRRTINTVEQILRSYGFSEREIVQMWLTRKGYIIADVLRFRTRLNGKPCSEEKLSLVREQLRGKLAFSAGEVDYFRHVTDLFP